jgi:eukaryotic-like serine/threonine-protein kinase
MGLLALKNRGSRKIRSWDGRTAPLQSWLILALFVVFILLASGCAGIRIQRHLAQKSYDWVTYGGTVSRTNESFSTVMPPLKPIWEYDALAGISGTPLVRDSVILVGTLRGELHAINIVTGDRMGYAVMESAVSGTPVWDEGNVYVTCALGTETLFCMSLQDAKRIWSGKYGPIETSPLVVGEFLYVVTLDGTLQCLKKVDGVEFWKYEFADKDMRKPVRSSPASDGEVIVFGSDGGGIYAVERLTGKLRWKYQATASIFATPVLSNGVCVVGAIDGVLYALNTRTGELRWKYETGTRIFAPAAATQKQIFIGTADGKVTALDLESGKKLWNFSCRSVVSCAPLVAGDILYVGSQDRNLYALRVATGEKIWQYEAPGRIKVSPVIWGDMMLLTYEDRYVAALKQVPQ